MGIIENFRTYFREYTPERFTTIQASSLEEYAKLVQAKGGKEITAVPLVTLVGGIDFNGINNKTYECSTLFSSRTKKGNVMYLEKHGKNMIDSGTSLVTQNKTHYNIKGVVTTEDRLRILTERIPGIITHGPYNKMDDSTRDQIKLIAQVYAVEPFPQKKDTPDSQI
jgi:hypothetical protein